MQTAAHTIRARGRRRAARPQAPVRWLGLGAAGLFSLLFAASAVAAAFLYTDLTRALPPVEAVASLLEPPNGGLLQPTRIYDRSGGHLLMTLQNPAAGERSYLRYPGLQENPGEEDQGQLPDNLVSVARAAEGPTIWSGAGFSLAGLLSGARSTMAERLAADLLLSHEPEGLRRTLRGKIVAAQLTRRYGDEKVLEWYLNSADFGYLAYGVGPAARLFFDKPATELSLAEAALLAAAAESSSRDAFENPEMVFARQKEILQEALERRLITPAEGITAFREIPEILYDPQQSGSLPYVVAEGILDPAVSSLIFAQLGSRLAESQLARGGLRILTTLDYDLQRQIECTARIQLERLRSRQGQPAGSFPEGCEAGVLLPTFSAASSASLEDISAELVVLHPANGQILALGGASSNIDGRAPLQRNAFLEHETGSLASLFVYAASFTRGLSPGSLVWDIPADDNDSADQAYLGPVRLRIAMTNGYQAPADAVLEQVGVENALRMARQLGIESPQSGAQVAVSASDLLRPLNLIEASHALSVFANRGSLAGRGMGQAFAGGGSSPGQGSQLPPLEPTILLSVDSLDGMALLDWSQPQTRPIVTPQLAYLFTNVLSDETSRWPSLGHPNPLEIGRPAAARFSRTPAGNSNWVTGYTPRYFVGIWMGRADPNGAFEDEASQLLRSAATGLWHAVIQYASQNQAYEVFEVPQGVNFVQVCDPSGLLPTAACPNVVDEIFLSGNEPVQYDTLYRLMAINRDTGNLATIFTSPELVEQRAFILVPPGAERWAKEAGFETPPVNFDALPAQASAWEHTRIQSPDPFSYLRGKVTIDGTAAGPDFSFYRVQYGQGPNPDRWYSIGDDSSQPVSAAALQEWDTSGLDGLYAVQLLVVRKDQSAERSTVFVSVDNTPPQVRILRPLNAETILLQGRSKIVLQSEVDDNLGVERVVFMIDGKTFATLSQPPYAISWELEAGQHTLQVIATDLAGNTAQAQIKFDVE